MAIPVRKMFLLLIFIVLILMAMSFFPESLSWTIHTKFDISAESNIPTWFSTLLLFCVSLTSFIIYRFGRDVESEASLQMFWLGFSAVYCFLSMDEASRIHESVEAVFHVKWFKIYAPFAAMFFIGCVYSLAIINKGRDLRNWILGGLIVYALGGLGGEMFSYYYFYSHAEHVFEESFEMLGTIMVLRGCSQELNRRYSAGCNRSVKT